MIVAVAAALGLALGAPSSTLERWQELGRAGVQAAQKKQLDVAEKKLREAVAAARGPGFATPYIDPYLTPLVTVLRQQKRTKVARAELAPRLVDPGQANYSDLALMALLQNADGDYEGALRSLGQLRQQVVRAQLAADDPRQSTLDAYAAFLSFATDKTEDGLRLYEAARKYRQKALVADPLEDALRTACSGYVERVDGRLDRAKAAFQKAADAIAKIDPTHANKQTLLDAAAR